MPDSPGTASAYLTDPGPPAESGPEGRPPRFAVGDAIAHPNHGAGRIVGIQTWEVGGVRRRYYSIELISEEGMLMIPVEQADEAGLRPAVGDPGQIASVLAEGPEELDDDHRKRQSAIADKIHSGDLTQVVEAVRDLAWRGQKGGLTERDQKLKAEAEALLIGELAVKHGLDLETAARRLSEEIAQALEQHTPSQDEEGHP